MNTTQYVLNITKESSTNNVNKGGKHCLHAEIRILNIRSCLVLFIKLSSTRSIFTLQNRPIVCCIYGVWRSDWMVCCVYWVWRSDWMVFAVFMGCDILIGWFSLYLWGVTFWLDGFCCIYGVWRSDWMVFDQVGVQNSYSKYLWPCDLLSREFISY